MAERSWSDTPYEVLSLILTRLGARDVTSFYGVCCSWRAMPFPVWLYPKSKMTQFPLLVCSREDSTLLDFFHPMCHHPTYRTVYGTKKEQEKETISTPELANAIIRFSKYGWLLMSRGERALFFFNPFTKERIDLPNLPSDYNFNGIAFSSPPTSPDCVVFGTTQLHREWIDYNFIRHGEQSWKTLQSYNNNHRYDFRASLNNPVFHNGAFYCLGLEGNLAKFDPNKQVKDCWTVLTKPHAPPCNAIKRCYIAECNGHLISVINGPVGKPVKVLKFDDLNMAWKELPSLGNRMLFISVATSFGLTSFVHPTASEINKIYFPRFDKDNKNNGVFYSLETHKYHTFEGDFAHEDYYNTREMSLWDCTWIQPSSDEKHTDEELQWCCLPTDSNDKDSDEEGEDLKL